MGWNPLKTISDGLSKAYSFTPLSRVKLGGDVGNFLERNKADIAAGVGTIASGGNPLVGAAIKAGMQGARGGTGLDILKAGISGYGVGGIANAGIGAAAGSSGLRALGNGAVGAGKAAVANTVGSSGGADMTDWGKVLDYGKKAVDIGGALVGMNQARQDAKGATGAANRAVNDANARYAERSPYRAIAQRRLTNPQTYDFSSEFTAKPDAIFDQASGVQSRTLQGLETSPDRIGMVKQALADLDKENAPRLAAGIRGIGQRAATLGRLGNQGVTTSIGDLASDIERDRQAKANELIRGATEADVNDRFRRLSAAGDIAGQRFGFGQQGIQNTAARIAAERQARGQDFSEGMSLADLGYGDTPDSANQWMAGRLDKSADANSAAVGDITSSLGELFGSRGSIDPGAAAAAARFRPVKAPVPQIQPVPLGNARFQDAPWRGVVSSPGPSNSKSR